MTLLTQTEYRRILADDAEKQAAINAVLSEAAEVRAKGQACSKLADTLTAAPGDPVKLGLEITANRTAATVHEHRAAELEATAAGMPKGGDPLGAMVDTVTKIKADTLAKNAKALADLRATFADLSRHDHVIKFGGMLFRGNLNNFRAGDFVDLLPAE